MKKIILDIIVIIGTLFILTACQENQNSEIEKKGIEYYKSYKYEKALVALKEAADSGSADAAYYLGKMYEKGEGVKKDDELSFKWYFKGAEKGDEESVKMVGSLYYFGKGVKQDYKEALQWYLKAAEKIDMKHPGDNDILLMAIIADMYLLGRGTLQDFSEAAKWFEKAGSYGNVRSQAGLAIMYYAGNGVLTDKKKRVIGQKKQQHKAIIQEKWFLEC